MSFDQQDILEACTCYGKLLCFITMLKQGKDFEIHSKNACANIQTIVFPAQGIEVDVFRSYLHNESWIKEVRSVT